LQAGDDLRQVLFELRRVDARLRDGVRDLLLEIAAVDVELRAFTFAVRIRDRGEVGHRRQGRLVLLPGLGHFDDRVMHVVVAAQTTKTRTAAAGFERRRRDRELRGGALQLFDGIAHEAARSQTILDRVEGRLHTRGLLLQFTDGANRGVVVHQAPGEVPGWRENAHQERQRENTHGHPHGASALHAG
jgi:hypothetical protein